MKTDHKPVAPKAAPLGAKPAQAPKPASKASDLEKLELELDDQATHVHRIPKELINRMKEREQERRAAALPPAEESDAPSSYEQEIPDEDRESLASLSDDRTAVFRPPPELLARAKRMRPPAKPDPVSEAPTKPPPPPDADIAGTEPMSALAAGVVPAAPGLPSSPAKPAAMAPVVPSSSVAPVQRPTPLAPARPTPMAPARLAPVAPSLSSLSKTPVGAFPAIPAPPPKASAVAAKPAAPVVASVPEPPPPSSARVVPMAVVSITGPARAPGDAPPSSSPLSSGRISAVPSENSGLIPLLVDPNAPAAAPPSAMAPSSANPPTAFTKDASAETSAPAIDVSESTDGGQSPGSSITRWLVALVVAGVVATLLIAWFRR